MSKVIAPTLVFWIGITLGCGTLGCILYAVGETVDHYCPPDPKECE